MVAMADEHQRVALPGKLDGLNVYLRHQRTSGVNDPEIAALAALAHRRRYAVGRVNDTLAIGNVVDLMDKDRALLCQLIHNVAVMHNLPPHIDGRAEGFESDLDNVDRADNAGAKASRLEQQDPFLTWGSPGVVTVRDGFKDS